MPCYGFCYIFYSNKFWLNCFLMLYIGRSYSYYFFKFNTNLMIIIIQLQNFNKLGKFYVFFCQIGTSKLIRSCRQLNRCLLCDKIIDINLLHFLIFFLLLWIPHNFICTWYAHQCSHSQIPYIGVCSKEIVDYWQNFDCIITNIIYFVRT